MVERALKLANLLIVIVPLVSMEASVKVIFFLGTHTSDG